MAISVASWVQIADWFGSATPRTVSATWSAGDIVVVMGGMEDALDTLNTPTVTGLTFSSVVTAGVGQAGNETSCYVWTATAASGSSGNISITKSGPNAKRWGMAIWVITGSPSGLGNNFGNLTEATTNLVVNSGSIVCYLACDWNANTTDQTAATGSGVSTERRDQGDGASYGQNVYDWVGTSAGTIAFGMTSYTGLKVAQVAVEVRGAAAATKALPFAPRRLQPPLMRR